MGVRRKVPHTTTRVLLPASPQQRREPACVVIVNGAQLGVEARIDEIPLMIGRAEDCGLVLSNTSVSRHHCRIFRDGPGYSVEDLGSTNGCFVNGEPVRKLGLRDGDRLRVGQCELKFFGEGSAEASYHRELLNNAVFDALTGFYNRRQSREMLEHAFDRWRRDPGKLRLMILDLDHFKPVNDRYGHLAGDRVLAGFADLVKSLLGADAVAGRLGGEEFVVFSAEQSAAEFLALAERIRAALESTDLAIDNGFVRVTVSIGLTEQAPDMRAAADLLRLADAALYKAKLGGRNRVVVGAG
ncbi:MAG TPA: GGDEF domain-containing protein [Xanthomonadales bacterium]|nr:GGDEF domain-containing protein [Xanthomonadales bacterium]